MKNERISQLKEWKRILQKRDNSMDYILNELCKIMGRKFIEDKNFDLWVTRPVIEPPAHLAAFFERWDILKYFLEFQNGTAFHPYHMNRYRETVADIIIKTKKHLTNDKARECLEKIRDLEKFYCGKSDHDITILGRYCHQCQNTKRIVTFPMK